MSKAEIANKWGGGGVFHGSKKLAKQAQQNFKR